MLMLPPPLRAPLAVLIACVTAVSAAPAISTVPRLTVRTPTSNVNVDGLENFKVTATIANAGDGTRVGLLNDPRGVLNPFPESSFTITDPSGSRPPFTGDSVDYHPAHAADLNNPDIFIVLAPGDSIHVTHNLPAAYSSTLSAAGGYSIEPSNVFTYIDADGIPKDLYTTVEGIAKVKLSGNPAGSRHVHDKRIKSKPRPKLNVNCSPEEQQVVEMAVWRARDAAAVAYSSLKSKGTPDAYTTWFGAYDSERKQSVKDNFKAVRDMLPKLYYRCGCDGYQEVYADRFGF